MADLLVSVGTRSAAVTAAAVVEAAARRNLRCVVVAAGPHCRLEQKRSFDVELGLTRSDVAGAEHDAAIAARIADAFESELTRIDPKLVVSAGDDSAAPVCAQAARRRHYRVARLDGGLRSGTQLVDEVSRKHCDHLSTYLYASGTTEVENLVAEGCRREQVERVGSLVCAAALAHGPAGASDGVREEERPCLVTVSRCETIDDYEPLRRVVEAVVVVSRCVPVVFPMDDQTRRRLEEFGLDRVIENEAGLRTCGAVDYAEFGSLLASSRLVLTDSGVVEEEAAARGISCLALRDATERTTAASLGSNGVVGTQTEPILEEALSVLEGTPRPHAIPELWDGLAGERVVSSLSAHLEEPVSTGAHASA
ncbi:MAG TPA: UDP-N-acetylglucosamine 2-epimerase [Gaiellaceae bacterium]|nr:UDP-N-acetylglucosamine 2-epimerase [Gaiellaceae bacterium]